MRVTRAYLQSLITQKDQMISIQRDTINSIRAENEGLREVAKSMHTSIGAHKQALRLAGETIKTIADAIPVNQ